MPRTPLPKSLLPCVIALACLVALTACENTIPSGASYVVAVPKAGFYKYGPAQTFGPDFMLDEDTEVTIIQHSMGFSRVTTSNGTSGWVSNDDIKPAPPKPPTAREVAVAKSRLGPVFAPKSKPGDVHAVPGSPLFEGGDLPPLPEKEPKVRPGFRY